MSDGITKIKRAAKIIDRRIEPAADYVVEKTGSAKHTGLIIAAIVVILLTSGAVLF